MKKMISFILVLLLMITLSGCGDASCDDVQYGWFDFESVENYA